MGVYLVDPIANAAYFPASIIVQQASLGEPQRLEQDNFILYVQNTTINIRNDRYTGSVQLNTWAFNEEGIEKFRVALESQELSVGFFEVHSWVSEQAREGYKSSKAAFKNRTPQYELF